MGDHQIAQLKQEAEACFLVDDPASVDIPTTEATIASPAGKGAPTLNKAFVAAVVASVARPGKAYAVGEGWAGDHHGGPGLGLLAGRQVTGEALGFVGMDSEVNHGLQGGGREFHGGYAVGAYYVGYILALRHGSPDVRTLAARAMAANLVVDWLLTVPGTGEVIEIGGRATGGSNTYSAIMQRLWAGDKDVRVPSSDAAISCQMFEELRPEERAMLPLFPRSVGEAVKILRTRPEDSNRPRIACPAKFEWWGWASTPDRSTDDWTGWRAQVNEARSWFIDKRTGPMALVVLSAPRKDESGKPIYGWPDRERERLPSRFDWHLTIGSDGLTVHRQPGGEVQPPRDDDDPPEPLRPPTVPRWQVHSWLSDNAPEWALNHLPEILWQAQRMERGVVEAEGMLVSAVGLMNKERSADDEQPREG